LSTALPSASAAKDAPAVRRSLFEHQLRQNLGAAWPDACALIIGAGKSSLVPRLLSAKSGAKHA
jgi:hypothetical protein